MAGSDHFAIRRAPDPARWQAPAQGRAELATGGPTLAFERMTFAPDFAVCRVSGRPPGAMMLYAPPTDAPRVHLQLVQRGDCALVADHAPAPMTADQGWLHFSRAGDVAWQVPSEQPLSVLSIDLSVDRVARWLGCAHGELVARLARQPAQPVETVAELACVALHLADHTTGASPARQLLVEAAALRAVARWLAPMAVPTHAGETSAQPAAARLAQRTRDRLAARDVPATLAALADDMGVAATMLGAAWRATFGTSLFQALLDARMRAAADAIERGDASIKQIAWRAGYTRATSFSAAFRRRYGVAPSVLRPER